MTSHQSSNEEQVEFWNGPTAESWVASQERMDQLLVTLSEQAIQRAAPQPGERVLDIGCGCGSTSLTMAGQGARVTGVDISEPMLANARARSAGNEMLEFILADASSHPFDTRFDLAFSRFGVMFFADPHQAFAHIRSAIQDQGRLCFICWQSPKDNPWLSVPGGAAQPFLPEPEAQPDPRAPGPFAFADPAYVQEILDQAGFTSIAIEPCSADMRLGSDVEEAVAFLLRNGPMSRVLAEVDEDLRNKALDAVRETLAPLATAEGIMLSGACWIASANQG